MGGAVLELYLTRPVTERIRSTDDTDVICEVSGRAGYRRLGIRLEGLGLRQSARHGDPAYRWRTQDGDVLDVMPTSSEVLGFSNRWYDPGTTRTVRKELEDGLTVRLLAPPYYLASKIEAYRNRGRSDPFGSPDFEDIVVLLASRREIVREVETAGDPARSWLRTRIAELFPESRIHERLAAHLPIRDLEGLQGTVRDRIERLTRTQAPGAGERSGPRR